jgi:hypothetical protein
MSMALSTPIPDRVRCFFNEELLSMPWFSIDALSFTHSYKDFFNVIQKYATCDFILQSTFRVTREDLTSAHQNTNLFTSKQVALSNLKKLAT